MAAIRNDANAFVAFTLMDGTIQPIGDRGYTWQVPGLGDGTQSNTEAALTSTGATQTNLTGWIFTSDASLCITAQEVLQSMILDNCELTDQHNVRHTVLLLASHTEMRRRRVSFGGVTYAYSLRCDMTIEAIL